MPENKDNKLSPEDELDIKAFLERRSEPTLSLEEVKKLLEDEIDLDTIRKRRNEPDILWEEVKKELGL